MPGVGEGWISEAKLIGELRQAFPTLKMLTQASPAWLKRLRFDAYFPEPNVAVEYQGKQHFDAVSIFGGRAGLVTTKSRDELKRKLSVANGCKLLYVKPNYVIEDIVSKLRSLMTSTQRSAQGQEVKTIRSNYAKPKNFTSITLGDHDINACARHGTGELIRSLAESGTDFEKLQKKKANSLIYIASLAGNLGTLAALLEVGLDVNARNCERQATALSRLCDGWVEPKLDAVRMLLAAGADPTVNGKGHGVTGRVGRAPPMIGAAFSHNLPLAKLLAEYKAKVTIRHNETGYTPFIAACYSKVTGPEGASKRMNILNWLVAKGNDPFALTASKLSAFDVAALRFG